MTTVQIIGAFRAKTEPLMPKYKWTTGAARKHGHLWASNGHILACLPDDQTITAHEDCPVDFQGFLDGHAAATGYRPIASIHIPEPDPCFACAGHCWGHECDTCPNKTASCDDGCDGFSSAADGPVHCHVCDGTGEDPYQAQEIGGGVYLAVRYLRLIATLPDAEIAEFQIGADPKNTPVYFRFDGGWGAVMPINPVGIAE